MDAPAEPIHDTQARDTGTSQAEGRLKVSLSSRRKKKIQKRNKKV
jgi:hypothetical protein